MIDCSGSFFLPDIQKPPIGVGGKNRLVTQNSHFHCKKIAMPADYGNPSYWDERYAAVPESYDWYQGFDTLKSFLLPYLKGNKDALILIPGCGNSTMGADLYDMGYKNITNIDVSEVVVQQMSDMYADKEDMEFIPMDACAMEFIPEQCCDLIIDKGLMDALLCTEDRLQNVAELSREMHRVLKKGGVYLVVSHGSPDTRLPVLQKSELFRVEHTGIPRPTHPKMGSAGVTTDENKNHFIYACRKA